MKVAVTAASGQLGAAVITQLVKEIGTENIIGIARTPAKAAKLGVEVRKGDYNSKADFDSALKGVDVVLIVSGMDAPDKRIGQHQNIINAAKDTGVKKIVYTSIIGEDGKSSFDAIVQSNRQTEQDVKDSGLDWAIGRNGLYIEPDVEYIENYKEDGKVMNCAADGLCSYTTRSELAYAASKGAIGQMTMAFANEWAAKGVNVNAIAPGYISTDNTEALRNDPVRTESILSRIPAGRWGAPEDFAGPIVFLCSDASSYMHGSIMLVDGGWMGR
jgi:NAD(P)-dependent dehydrogenase (short-subunit alcohol dehydrogenase family)